MLALFKRFQIQTLCAPRYELLDYFSYLFIFIYLSLIVESHVTQNSIQIFIYVESFTCFHGFSENFVGVVLDMWYRERVYYFLNVEQQGCCVERILF